MCLRGISEGNLTVDFERGKERKKKPKCALDTVGKGKGGFCKHATPTLTKVLAVKIKVATKTKGSSIHSNFMNS